MCFQVCVTDRNPSQGAFSCDQDKTQSPQPLHLPGSEVGRDPGVEGWASDGDRFITAGFSVVEGGFDATADALLEESRDK